MIGGFLIVNVTWIELHGLGLTIGKMNDAERDKNIDMDLDSDINIEKIVIYTCRNTIWCQNVVWEGRSPGYLQPVDEDMQLGDGRTTITVQVWYSSTKSLTDLYYKQTKEIIGNSPESPQFEDQFWILDSTNAP